MDLLCALDGMDGRRTKEEEILKEKFDKNVLEVKRGTDRRMSLKGG